MLSGDELIVEKEKEKRDFKIEKCVILGHHRTKGFVTGNIIFPNEEQAHKHWKICKYAHKVDNYTFYIVMPVK